MNKKVNIDYKRIPHYIFIAAIVIALLILNYLYFSNHISSNSEVINNYSLRDEDMNTTRVPAVAGLFIRLIFISCLTRLTGIFRRQLRP